MNEQNNIDRKLKIELDLFKIFAVFVIATSTGFASILYKVFDNTNTYSLRFLIILLSFSIIISIISIVFFVKSYLKIQKYKK